MTNLVRIDSATPEDLILNAGGDFAAAKLRTGTYVIADPKLILEEDDWELWEKIAEIPSSYRIGPGGLLYSARINGHPVSGITTYTGSGDFTEDHGHTVVSTSGIIAAFPIALIDELGIDCSKDLAIDVLQDDMIFYSDSSFMIWFGISAEFYTGYPEDEED